MASPYEPECKQKQISPNTTQTRWRQREKQGSPSIVTFQCEAALSELPTRLITALLQQEPRQRETWETENWPPAQTENMKPFLWPFCLSHAAAFAGQFEWFSFYWPSLYWDPSSAKPGLPQACEWSLPLRTNWSLQILQMSTTCRNITETNILWISSSSKENNNVIIS